jgi:4-amino-4-deoxy-L-arabinose transferase-like glycosyltransferase
MASRRPQLRTVLLLTLIAAVFATTTLVWLYVDRTPPNWDDAWYLTNSLTVYDALTHDGLVGYLTKVESAFTFRAPLIAMLPTPFYLVLGRHWHAAYLVNIGSMILLFAAVYNLARQWWRTRAGLFAVLIVGTMPLIYGLATWFMVEYALTAIIAAAVWLLIESDGLARRGVVVLFGVVCGLGLLLKASFSMFILFPFLYFWIKSRDRLRSLLYASIPCLVVALPWYAIHLRETVEYGFAAGYGKTATVYGTGAIFSFHSIASYLSNVVKKGISGYYASLTIVLGGWTIWRRWNARAGDAVQARPEAWAILFWLLPFVIYLFGVNKDVRLIAPILPAFALLLASMLDSTVPRRGAGIALASAVIAFPLFQLYSISFGVPFDAAEMGYARRFRRDSWRHDEIVKAIAANAHIGPGDRPLVLVGTDVATLNPNNVELTVAANLLPLRVETTAHEENLGTVQARIEGASFFVYKEGGQPESPFNATSTG